MKYKIGNVDVEAVQWNGDNFNEIATLLFKIKKHNITTKYNGAMHLYISDNYIYRSQYIVVSKESHFVLSEQDFNNMATKVKEPKFKVGDKVYFIEDMGDQELSIVKDKVIKYCDDGKHYHTEDFSLKVFREYELFTLEEAIEKLKEL